MSRPTTSQAVRESGGDAGGGGACGCSMPSGFPVFAFWDWPPRPNGGGPCAGNRTPAEPAGKGACFRLTSRP